MITMILILQDGRNVTIEDIMYFKSIGEPGDFSTIELRTMNGFDTVIYKEAKVISIDIDIE